ncbi:hypothetical protein BAUCODRAFT_150597 [Baudoinia panamericana UAMH 10762]|uniref:Amidase domain-containing protein n=1 Tax=Baudoinia panamericana (strain UAMH 10762) TaxID=717646 RepID=M2M9W3_BAUPA|nr:uncharacterized protein BAUCODRAFT_150597 [Baudoinia panamericana UAMH 10762]EMC93241.1 hypothetical protein BAUCODRAFT_150597 [Baudoinia panamericana UAMH 10762]
MRENIVEASIAELQSALCEGAITSVELTTKYLQRILTFDCRGPCLNSIIIYNPSVFDEASASDTRRAAGQLRSELDGIPYTLKDSMMYKGMTCASGSPALEHLVANEDSFVAERLRKAGAVLLGRTNTPPMMASGMHRGLYGRAESPYNLEYLTAAFSSGSSNGAATSTAASFAAFGLGSETVSSGRSPASNNALIAYTPSRTVISPRGIWPLYPTCDVVVPMARRVVDMLAIADVLTAEDTTTKGDFWRQQEFVEVPKVKRPTYSDLSESTADSLQGKKIAVPASLVGGNDPRAKPTTVSPKMLELWKRAKSDLELLGASVVETDFPLVTNYEDDSVSGHTNNVVGFKPDWNGKERGELVSYLWDDFLKANGDPHYLELASVDGAKLFPNRPEGYLPDRWLETKNFMNYPALVETARERHGKSIWEIDGIREALPALEAQRKRDLEDWMDQRGIDMVVFPANGDVGKADLEINEESAKHALQNGVKYSNGNRAIRHMGVPTVSVTMGFMVGSGMPVNLTFAGKHGQDSDLLKYAFAFEQQSRRREPPPLTPPLQSDFVPLGHKSPDVQRRQGLALVKSHAMRIGEGRLRISGTVDLKPGDTVTIDAYVAGSGSDLSKPSVTVQVEHVSGQWSLETDFIPFEAPKPLYGGYGEGATSVPVLLRAYNGEGSTGRLILVK